MLFFVGEGGRLRLMPNNKPTPRIPAKTNTPSTRRIFMTKCMFHLMLYFE